MKTRTIYIHTLNHQPATFDGNQICFAMLYGVPSVACSSLKQIRREQAKSQAWRIRQGYGESGWEAGYRRYRV